MKPKKKFGEIMRKTRKEQGVTHNELAQTIGTSPEYCRAIEKGEYAAPWTTWVKICMALKIDITVAAESCVRLTSDEAKDVLSLKS